MHPAQSTSSSSSQHHSPNPTLAVPFGEPILDTPQLDEPEPSFEAHHHHHHQATSRPETMVNQDADLEKAEEKKANVNVTTELSTATTRDPNVVDWDGPNDPANPLNWKPVKKWGAMYAVAAMCLVSPLASTLMAPTMPQVARELGITDSTVAALVVSIFVLGYSFGPLIASPLSEIYGRVIVLQGFMAFFFVFNIACAVAKNPAQLIIFRFLAGCGGSAPLTVGAAVLSDLFIPQERGKAMGIFSLGPLVGPIIGPIAGGFMSMKLQWRWPLWLLVIISGVVLLISFFALQETYHALLLERKAKRLRKETGNEKLTTAHVIAYGEQSAREIFARNMSRPFKLLFTNAACALISVYMAVCYGYLYLMFVTFSDLFTVQYGQSIGISGIQYLAPGLGMLIGSIAAGLAMDRVYKRLSAHYNSQGRPEFRIPLMIFAAFLVPIGLIIYGWTAEKHTHWIVPDIGAFIFTLGVMTSFLALNTYVVDAFEYVASAIAATTVIRSAAGALFPLFGNAMFDKLGLGWGNTLLALVALLLGTTYPVFLWHYGPRLRGAKGKQ